MPQALRHVLLSLALLPTTAASLWAADIDVRSSVDSVIIYPDGATVTRIIRLDIPGGDSTLVARDFPPTLDPSSLRVEGEGGARLVIGAIDARPPRAERPPLDPALEARIEGLRDDRAALDDRMAAAAARRQFALRFAESAPMGLGEKGEARPLTEWRAAFSAVAEEVASADDVIRDARLRQRAIDRDLALLEAQRIANPPRKMEVRVDVAADAPAPTSLRVSYSVRGARWAPLYDARLNSGGRGEKPALALVRRAEIVQNTGEDWSDVELYASTVRTAKGGNAPELDPLLVRFPAPLAPVPARAASQSAPLAYDRLGQNFRFSGGRSDEGVVATEEREAIFEGSDFQTTYRIPGRVTIATNEGAKAFRISTLNVTPDLSVRAAPLVDNTAFLEASFRHAEEAPLLPGRVAIYRDGIFVGRGQMTLTPKDETVRLGFGADEQVKVSRVPVRRIDGSTGIISTAKISEREFKISVRNGHDMPLRVVIEDQVPVSEVDDVQVEILPMTTAPTKKDVRDRRGVLAWEFDAKPGEVRDLKLGWRVRWPTNRDIAYYPRQP